MWTFFPTNIVIWYYKGHQVPYRFCYVAFQFLLNLKYFLIFRWFLLWPLNYLEVQFSHSVVSDSLWPHEPQHARPPCPSLTPGVHPNPCPLSRWCYPTTSSSVVPFSSCPQSFPASGSFQMSQLFASGGSVLFNFQIFGDFPDIILLLISSLIPLWSEISVL